MTLSVRGMLTFVRPSAIGSRSPYTTPSCASERSSLTARAGGGGDWSAIGRAADPTGAGPGRQPMTHSGRRGGGQFALHQTLGCVLDHLVGGREQRRRNRQAKRLGALEVDGELIFCWLLKRQIAG